MTCICEPFVPVMYRSSTSCRCEVSEITLNWTYVYTAVAKKKHKRVWTPNFFCLAESDQDTVPSTVAAKEALVQSVLGEKKVEVEEELSPQQFKEVIIENFPKLKDSGGFELLRCVGLIHDNLSQFHSLWPVPQNC